MEPVHGFGTILIVMRQRDERRALFNAFDGYFEAIYSAADVSQARSLLESVPRVDLILLEFPVDSRRVVDFCAELACSPVRSRMSIIGMLKPGTRRMDERPVVDGVVDWLASPVAPETVLEHIGTLLPRNSTPAEDYTVESAHLAGAIQKEGAASAPRVEEDRRALHVLAELPRADTGPHGFDAPLCALAEMLGFDLALLLESDSDKPGGAQPIGAFPSDSDLSEVNPLIRPMIERVLDGVEVIAPNAAMPALRAPSSARGVRFDCMVGLPLCNGNAVCFGALLLARREACEIGPGLRDALRAIASRLAVEVELHNAREQGRVRGLRDALTALPNRLLLNEHLAAILKEAHRSGEMFAVMFIDIDRFKNINDSLGHAIGDQVLMAMAKRLRFLLRASDLLARYAGDEFIMILRHVALREDVVRVADKIVRMMEAPLALDTEVQLHVTVSIGISFHPQDATSAERLLKQADSAMYAAKRMGRNNFQAYVAAPEEAQQQRLALETKLHGAEKNGELRVYYQPQVDGAGEDIVGMEALLRWEHPDLGMISPGFFIPLAEASGLIMPLGEWVLRAACTDARRWQQRFQVPLRLGVNLSPLQLRQPGFAGLVREVLDATGLDPVLLELEITESVSMKAIPNLLETLNALHALGCSISIDDFGTGQSSLDYLKRFPVDGIKIDQSFVRNIGVDPDDEAIVRATISMARSLNRSVVAEGVETEEHLDFLREEDCDALQGYLFCRPLSAQGFEMLLAERVRLRPVEDQSLARA
ncbi:MAG: bifunctional diguanylate cyclase/phosphodiesterase [Rhodanobacteraceae bacterium]